jgi:putative thioredoxin
MNPSFSGAFDLSKLRPSEQSSATTNPATAAGAPVATVPSYVLAADESLLREYLQLSSQVVLLLVFSGADDSDLDGLRQDLEQQLALLQGRALALDLKLADNLQLAQSVGVSQTPSVVAVIGGQPAPLFQGRPDQESLSAVLQQVIQLATQNGVSGRIAVQAATESPDSAMQPTTLAKSAATPLPPALQQAQDSFERGDFSAALAAFSAFLKGAPASNEAKLGLAQSELMVRLQDASGVEPGLATLLQQADKLYAAGQISNAFNSLLDAFTTAEPDQRPDIQNRLLQYFLIAGDDEPEVNQARRRLSSLLF